MSGRLLIVGTPLGNLSDFPPRAVEALKSADLILCEDTRHTRKLLTHFGSLAKIRQASVEDLKDVVTRPQAEAVWRYFHEASM